MDKPVEELNKIVENLQLIIKNNFSFSQIEKDIVLQALREAYVLLLNHDTNPEDMIPPVSVIPVEKKEIVEEEIKEPEKISEVDFQPEPEQILIPEPLSETKQQVEEIFEDEQMAKDDDTGSAFETISEVEPEEILDEINFENDDILEFLPDKSLKNENLIFEKEAKTQIPSVTFEKDILKESNIEEVTQPFVEDKPIIDPVFKAETDFSRQNIHKEEISQKVPSSLFDEISEKENNVQKRSLNDLLIEQKKDNSLNTKYQNTKISDLTKSISINDKFLFIRELFKNRGEEFSQAIQALNNCNNIEEAFSVMEKMKKHYFWDSTSPAYLALCDLVRRKF